MKITLTALLVLLSFVQGLAQERTCDCQVAFTDMIEKLEANYIGLQHFYQKGRKAEYEQRKADFLPKASGVTAENCASFLQDFLDYFEDGHVYVIERPEYTPGEMEMINAKLDRERKAVSELKAALIEQKKGSSDPLIGYYNDGTSELIILKQGDHYEARILESKDERVKPGELKVIFNKAGQRYRGTYYSYAHAPRFMKAGLFKQGTLLKVESSVWIKTDSGLERELSMVNFEEGTNLPTVQKLDEDNVLVSIPSFSIDFEAWKKVLEENEEIMLNAKNLIVDIRGNRGGNAIYFSFFDLFADRKRLSSQGHVLASEDNKAYFSRFSHKIYKQVIERMEGHMGEIIDGPRYPGQFIKRNKKSKVEHLAILTDEACMSAAESFIIHARRASSIVQTFGSPTDGVIDYTSVNALKLNSGNQNILFGYPTGTLHKEIPDNGYNKTGMLPDVPIDKAVKDQVAFIMDYYKKN